MEFKGVVRLSIESCQNRWIHDFGNQYFRYHSLVRFTGLGGGAIQKWRPLRGTAIGHTRWVGPTQSPFYTLKHIVK